MLAVDCSSVCERVARVKSSKRSLSTTVRPTRLALRIRRVTRSTSAIRSASSSPGVHGRRPRARCEPIERRRRRLSTRPRIEVAGERVQLTTLRAADERDQQSFVHARDLADGRDADVAQLPRRDRPDAPQPLDLEWMQERELLVGRHEQQAVGLRDAARDLREELRACDADGDRQPDLVLARGGAACARSRAACRRCAPCRARRGTPRRSRAPRRPARCRRRRGTRPSTPPSTPGSAPARRSPAGTAAARAAGPSPCARRTPSPRSSPRARRPCRRSPACPSRRGSSRCSTEAKNESRSACRIVDTNTCSHTLAVSSNHGGGTPRRARRSAVAGNRPRLRPADGARAAPVPDLAAPRRAARPRRAASAPTSTTPRS